MHRFVVLIWFLGGLARIFQQTRFFQIEEYQGGRYLRWLAAHPERWGWRRPLIAWSVMLLAAFFLPDSLPEWALAVGHGVAALVAVWPSREKEIKKRFVPTQRALRLLIASFALFGLATVWAVGAAEAVAFPGILVSYHLFTAGVGLVLLLVSPLFLVAGNVLAYPVEAALRRLFLTRARRVLARLQPTVIGITGSYGKTSTKHYLAHILDGRYRVVATPKSYNTLMGVTLAVNTLLKDESAVDYFIVEMGAYRTGEIAEICALTRPQISIVTAVGPQHLERFGSLDAVADAKYEIVAALPPDGTAVLNADDPRVRAMADRAPAGASILVSREGAQGARLVASNVAESLDGLDFDVLDTASGEKRRFHAPLYGLHNVTNILLAVATARHLGLSLGEAAMRVAALEPFEHRLQRTTWPGGITVLDDAYSCNPVGAANALRVLGLHDRGRRILITPGMVELGPLQDEENRKLGANAAGIATDIILVGVEQTRPIYEGVLAAGFDQERLHVFDTRAEAIAWLRENARAGDAVLFLNDLPDTYL